MEKFLIILAVEISTIALFIFLIRKISLLESNLKELGEKHNTLIDDILEYHDDKDELYKFTLQCVIREAVIREDYETAKKCKNILEKEMNEKLKENNYDDSRP